MKQIQPSNLRTPQQEVSTLKSFQGDLKQIDILGPFPSSPYKYVLTAIDVFDTYISAVPLTTISAVSVATALVSTMLQHSYKPQEYLSHLGTQFVRLIPRTHPNTRNKNFSCTIETPTNNWSSGKGTCSPNEKFESQEQPIVHQLAQIPQISNVHPQQILSHVNRMCTNGYLPSKRLHEAHGYSLL